MLEDDLTEQVAELGFDNGIVYELFKEGYEMWFLDSKGKHTLGDSHHNYKTVGTPTRIDGLKTLLELEEMRAITIGDVGVYQDLQQLGEFVRSDCPLGELYPSVFVYGETGKSIPVIWGSRNEMSELQTEFILDRPGLFPVTTIAKHHNYQLEDVLLAANHPTSNISFLPFMRVIDEQIRGPNTGMEYTIIINRDSSFSVGSNPADHGRYGNSPSPDSYFTVPKELVPTIIEE
jgi:hypothetical protein